MATKRSHGKKSDRILHLPTKVTASILNSFVVKRSLLTVFREKIPMEKKTPLAVRDPNSHQMKLDNHSSKSGDRKSQTSFVWGICLCICVCVLFALSGPIHAYTYIYIYSTLPYLPSATIRSGFFKQGLWLMHKQASGAPFFFQTRIRGWIGSWPLFLVLIAKPLASWRSLFFQIRFAVELDLLGIMVTGTKGMEWNLTQNQSWNRGHEWILEGSVEGVTFETGKIQKKNVCIRSVYSHVSMKVFWWNEVRGGGMIFFFHW